MSDNNAEIAVNFRMNEMMIDEAFENAMASSKAATFASMKQHLQQQPMNSIYTIAKPHPQQTQFNIDAPPFEMPSAHYRNMPKIKIGPSAVEVNSNIWSAIASNRPLPHLQSMPQLTIASPTQSSSLFSPMASTMSSPVVNAHYGYNGVGYPTAHLPQPSPQIYDDCYPRSGGLLFPRHYGPVASVEGYVELRLKEDITIYISVDRTILIRNPKARVSMAVSHDLVAASLEHSNGKIYQPHVNQVDMILYDSTRKMGGSNIVRYAKMWEKGVSLTSDGCALTYLVDNAGSRTTSDAVNKDYMTDYALKVFTDCSVWGAHLQHEAEKACSSYKFTTLKDGVHMFEILGYRIQQTTDGMVQVSRPNNLLRIHTSPSNGSARISTPYLHATASMGRSAHLFVRHNERRMHFCETTTVVRNQGHSAGFDEDNHLRIY